VKAPRSCPKSSFSIKVSGIAAQLSATKGPPRRGDRPWTARAKSSFPVPLSPSSRTVLSVGATRSSRRREARSRGWLPRIVGPPGTSNAGALSPPSAAATRRQSSSISSGFSRKSAAPSFMASTAVDTVP
jgi:hypothetical protein